MGENTYRILMRVAILMTLAWIGWTFYDSFIVERMPHQQELASAARFLEDGRYERARSEYLGVIQGDPENIYARRGLAHCLSQLGEVDQALNLYDEVITAEPEFAGSYANRGILKDRMGDYEGAIADYERAIALDPETSDGPGLMTRFLRNQPDKPPTIADRARYLRGQLAKPEYERLLRVPEEDAKQRPYKM